MLKCAARSLQFGFHVFVTRLASSRSKEKQSECEQPDKSTTASSYKNHHILVKNKPSIGDKRCASRGVCWLRRRTPTWGSSRRRSRGQRRRNRGRLTWMTGWFWCRARGWCVRRRRCRARGRRSCAASVDVAVLVVVTVFDFCLPCHCSFVRVAGPDNFYNVVSTSGSRGKTRGDSTA